MNTFYTLRLPVLSRLVFHLMKKSSPACQWSKLLLHHSFQCLISRGFIDTALAFLLFVNSGKGACGLHTYMKFHKSLNYDSPLSLLSCLLLFRKQWEIEKKNVFHFCHTLLSKTLPQGLLHPVYCVHGLYQKWLNQPPIISWNWAPCRNAECWQVGMKMLELLEFILHLFHG